MAELADPVHDLRLAALQVADEVPAEGLAPALVLRLEVLRAVLADHLDARLGQHAHVLERHVLRRRDDRHARADLGADALEVLADEVRRRERELPASHAAFPGGGARRRAPGCSACRGRRARPARPPRERSARSDAAQRSRMRPRVRSAVEPLGDLGPDLVAARPDRRADARREPPAAERAHALGDDPLRQAAPAGVERARGRPVAVRSARSRSGRSRRSASASARRARPSRDRLPARSAPARPGARARSAAGGSSTACQGRRLRRRRAAGGSRGRAPRRRPT